MRVRCARLDAAGGCYADRAYGAAADEIERSAFASTVGSAFSGTISAPEFITLHRSGFASGELEAKRKPLVIAG